MGRKAWINADWIADIDSLADLRVLLAIAAHAQQDGTGAYPTTATIGRMAGFADTEYATRSVRRSVTRLIDKGFLIADRTGGHRPSQYTIPRERIATKDGRITSTQDGHEASAQDGRTLSTQDGRTLSAPDDIACPPCEDVESPASPDKCGPPNNSENNSDTRTYAA